MDNDLYIVGTYTEQFNNLTNSSLPIGSIYMSPGVMTHVQKRHPNCVSYLPQISSIITTPDYIGRNPKEPNSIELVKVLDKNIQVAIKLDLKDNYLYVASLYDVPQGKINRRLQSGRLKKFT